MVLLEIVFISLSSLITLTLVYYAVPASYLQQISAFILIIIVLLLGKIVKKDNSQLSKNMILCMTFLTALITQIGVISTGGFYSPLLILIYLYTIASGFLLNITTSTTFLIVSFGILGIQLYWDQALQLRVREDPGIVAIYVVSAVIVVPLSQYVMKTYNVKDKMSKALGEYLHLDEQREASILSGLNELVCIIDRSLKIISINEAAEKLLNASSQMVIGKRMLDVLPIYNTNNERISQENLSINEVLQDKAIRIVRDMVLILPTGQHLPIVIQIKPIQDSQGSVNQLVFIITDAKLFAGKDDHHPDLQELLTKYQLDLNVLRNTLAKVDSKEASVNLEIVSHIEEDIRTLLEMEDHPIKEKIALEDIAFIAKQAIESKKPLIDRLNVVVNFILPPEDVVEKSMLVLKEQGVDPKMLAQSAFTVPIDVSWFKLLVQKILDIAILLAWGEHGGKVELLVKKTPDEKLIIEIISYTVQVKPDQTEDLFVKNYARLANTNLKYGSGMEGFIARSISTQLQLSLSARVWQAPTRVVFTLVMPETT